MELHVAVRTWEGDTGDRRLCSTLEPADCRQNGRRDADTLLLIHTNSPSLERQPIETAFVASHRYNRPNVILSSPEARVRSEGWSHASWSGYREMASFVGATPPNGTYRISLALAQCFREPDVV